jgi:hypothetical protein
MKKRKKKKKREKMYQYVCKTVQIREPRPFQPRDIARLIDRYRLAGGDDITLIRYILDSFGIGDGLCILVRILDSMAVSLFIGSIYGINKALKAIIKALGIIKLSRLAKIFTAEVSVMLTRTFKYIFPAEASAQVGKFLLLLNVVVLILELSGLYLAILASAGGLISLLAKVCTVSSVFTPAAKAINIGSFLTNAQRISKKQSELDKEIGDYQFQSML